ncbi:MAG TPA: group 1 truncated hemoglobin [Planctomycetaceae bacterium]|nr:group 1 truncated hemoglobin [Planctomycetaceae bacterium]
MSESLFDALGGAEVVAKIVDSMYDLVLRDPSLSPFFTGVDVTHLRKMQYEFLASALGGPISYSGAELQAIHSKHSIGPTHFATFVGHMATAMKQHGATEGQVDEMLGQIAMFRDRIVGSSNVDG